MSKRILNKRNCTFICPSLQGTITITQPPNQVNDGNGTPLTQNQAKLSGNGICAILTAAAGGTPTSCTLKLCGNWIAGFELQKKLNGDMLLNEDAKMACPVGSIISVQKPMLPIPPVMPVVSAGSMSSTPETQSSAPQKAKQPEPFSASPEAAENKPPETKAKESAGSKESGKKEPEQAKSEEPAVPYEEPMQCNNCKEKADCPYMQAPDTINTDGAASKLRKNSPGKERDYDEKCDRSMEKWQRTWGSQAHHMISAKAAYCQYPELVKIGNYVGYNINCQENCYFLPAWEHGDGFGQKNEHFKKAQAYEVMRMSGLQWHVGNHSYHMSELPESVMEKYPQLREMLCYNDRINQDVQKILDEFQKHFKDTCLKKRYEECKSWFFEKMNALSMQVEEHLDLFGMYPKDSNPYFVSLESLRYAYEIPRSGKVISVHKTASAWILKRYRYTNWLHDAYYGLDHLETKVLADTENHREKTIRDLILFCENVSCFLLIDETESFRLPFSYRVNSRSVSREETEQVSSHFTAMLASQADNGEDEYLAPKAVIKKRMEECGLL